jgi:nucleoside-diphosphate-sugar epimerase
LTAYLVTGCAGFIGSHLTEALLERGDGVLGVDAFTDYYSRERKEANLAGLLGRSRFRFVEADLAEAPLDDFVAGRDGIFHLAAQPGVRGSWGDTFSVYAKDNLVVSQRIFEAAAARSIRVVWASSSSIYGDAEVYPTSEDVRPRPISPYGVTKLTCEHLAEAYRTGFGLDHVALRYFTVYGPRQRPDMGFSRIIDALATGEEFEVYGTGEQTRDVTYVGDAVAATIAAMELAPSGTAYNLGGGSETSLLDVIELSEQLSGRQLARTHREVARGDVRRTAADTTRAETELAWEPQTPLVYGLAAQIAAAGITPVLEPSVLA